MSSYVREKASLAVQLGDEIVLELTERCNNNCVHCCVNLPADSESARASELSTDSVLAIAREAASLGFMTVRFTGGEPLLRSDFAELYVGVRRMGMKVCIFTNGTLITPELADLFARIPPMMDIEITMYGMHRESYEAVSRAPGSFQAARRGVQLLLDRGVPVYVKGAMLPGNVSEMDEFKEWAQTIPGMDKPPSYVMDLTLRRRRDDQKKNDLIRSLQLSPAATASVFEARGQAYIDELLLLAQRSTEPVGDRVLTCGTGVCVDPYGFLYRCPDLRCPETAYDLRAGSLKDALHNFMPKLKEMRVQNPDYLARCARCCIRSLCAQCPAKSWAEHGAMDMPIDRFCDVAHGKARYIGLLADGERAWKIGDWEGRIQRLTEERRR